MSGRAFLAVLAATPFWLWLVHAAILRASRASPQGAAFISLALGAPMLAAGSWGFLEAQTGARLTYTAAYAAIVYSCLAYFYFHLFNLGETSRRLRILGVLYERGEVPREELERLYPPLSQIDVRLERLAAMGQIEEVGGRYRLKGRGLWLVAALVEAWRGFWGFV